MKTLTSFEKNNDNHSISYTTNMKTLSFTIVSLSNKKISKRNPAKKTRITADPAHNFFNLYKIASPMACDGWCLRRDHRDLVSRLSAPRPTTPVYNPERSAPAEPDQEKKNNLALLNPTTHPHNNYIMPFTHTKINYTSSTNKRSARRPSTWSRPWSRHQCHQWRNGKRIKLKTLPSLQIFYLKPMCQRPTCGKRNLEATLPDKLWLGSVPRHKYLWILPWNMSTTTTKNNFEKKHVESSSGIQNQRDCIDTGKDKNYVAKKLQLPKKSKNTSENYAENAKLQDYGIGEGPINGSENVDTKFILVHCR